MSIHFLTYVSHGVGRAVRESAWHGGNEGNERARARFGIALMVELGEFGDSE